MRLVPVVKSGAIARSVDFYAGILGFQVAGVWPGRVDPAYAILTLGGQELHLSSHAGDGVAGQHIVFLTDDVDAAFAGAVSRGHLVSDRPESPLHQGPVEQTWGTREAAIDDPDGNTIVFIQRAPGVSRP